jgi:hypothetical protein
VVVTEAQMDNLAKGYSIFAALLLAFFCYSYRFKQFKTTARAIAVMSGTIFVLIVVSFPFIVPSVERIIPDPAPPLDDG